ncbi:MAG: hypothetical protein OXC37_01425 [Bdellovibrionaceae bacterium]|nr:hypothetical protein [Pseudobdellovibrionaceae bacterium]
MNNINIKIHNYKENPQQIKDIYSKLDHLLRLIPYNSRVNLDYIYKNRAFHGKLKIASSGKSFISTDEDILLAPLTVSLCKKIKKQIKRWKKTRTLDEITGNIKLPKRKQEDLLNYK